MASTNEVLVLRLLASIDRITAVTRGHVTKFLCCLLQVLEIHIGAQINISWLCEDMCELVLVNSLKTKGWNDTFCWSNHGISPLRT